MVTNINSEYFKDHPSNKLKLFIFLIIVISEMLQKKI